MSKNLARKVKRRYTHPILSRSSRTHWRRKGHRMGLPLPPSKNTNWSQGQEAHTQPTHVVIFSAQQIHYEKRKGEVKEKMETLFYVTL